MMRSATSVALALVLSIAACGDDPVVSGGEPGISFLAGANVADTVDATPVQALRVQVRGTDGKAAAHEVVRVEAVPRGPALYEVLASRLGEHSYQHAVSDTTDEDGIVHFQVRMGTAAGVARLLVTAPAPGMQDTARFEVLPGAPISIQGPDYERVMVIGGSIPLDMRVTDRYGNPRSDAIGYASSSSSVSVTGSAATGVTFGSATITATAGPLISQSIVYVVPSGSIAFNVYPTFSGPGSALYTANLDGSNLIQLAMAPEVAQLTPAWLSSTELLYADEMTLNRTLQLVDVESGAQRRFLAPAQQMEIEHHPRVSHDRQWVFFSGGTVEGYWLYRVRPTGEGLERLSPHDALLSHWMPAPSPDGSQVAYGVQGAPEGGFEIMDVETKAVRHIPVAGERPSWSPDGTRIAYFGERLDLRTVKPDGTDDRSIAYSPHGFFGWIDWSPDSKYLVTTSEARLTIVEVATGQVVKVATPGINGYFISPVWRPDAH